MSQPTTHLGNKELHKKHTVEIEPGPVPRARLKDQTIIDHYLEKRLITARQHQAGEYFLRQAGRAGVWPKGVNWNASGGGRGKPDYVPYGAMPYGSTVASVRDNLGEFHAYLLNEVILYDWDVSHDPQRMDTFRESLDWVADHRMGHRYDPVSGLKALAAKKAVNDSGKSNEQDGAETQP